MDNSSTLSTQPSQFISVSNLFEETVKWYKSHWRMLIKIQAIPFVVSVLNVVTLLAVHDKSLASLYAGIYALLALLASGFASLALMWFILREQEVTWQEAYKKSLTLALPSFFVLILSIGITLLGFLLLIIPGIYFALAYSFSQYALFTDNKRGMEALRMSKSLIQGHWWGVLGRTLLFGILISIIQMILSAGSIAPQWETLTKAIQEGAEPEIQSSPIFELLGNAFAFLVAAPLGIIFTFLMYKSLKESKGQVE